MAHKRPFIHESVANVLADIGVKRASANTNKPNNSKFVAQGVQDVLESLGCNKKVIKEAKSAPEGDETDGDNPDSTTTVSNKATGTAVKNTPSDTEVAVEGEDDKKEDKEESKDEEKSEKKDEKKSDDKEEDKKDDKKPWEKDGKDEKKEEKADESETFYGSRPNVLFMFFEGKDGKMTAEVHGLTEAELAPFGGKCPAISPKYAALAKKDKGFNDGCVGALALYNIEKMDAVSQQILTGSQLKAVGWKAPMKGTGKPAKIATGGMDK